MNFDVRAKESMKKFEIEEGARYTVYTVEWVRGPLFMGKNEVGSNMYTDVDVTFFLLYIPNLGRFIWSDADNFTPADLRPGDIKPQIQLAKPGDIKPSIPRKR